MTEQNAPRVFAFPDANVLLHGKPLQSIPWSQVLQAQEVTVILAPSVLGEIDQKMHEGPAALRRRAKQRAKWLHGVRTGTGPALPSALSIEFANVARSFTYQAHELDRNWGDDRLLAAVLEREEQEPGKCVVVTLDYHLTSRADAYGLAWHRLDDRYQQAVPPDVEIAEIRRELERLKLAQLFAAVNLTSEDSKGFVHVTRPSFQPLTEAQIETEMAEVRASHPKVGRSSTSIIVAAYFSLSENDRQTHNSALEDAYAKYRDYIDAREHHRRLRESIVPVRFRILNSGSAPARDVRVYLTLVAPGAMFVDGEAPGKEPQAPRFPKLRRPLDVVAGFDAQLWNRPHLPLISPPRRKKVLRVVDPTHATYRMDSLMHGLPETFETLVMFDESLSASGKLLFEVHADGQPTASTGEIGLVIVEP